MKTKLTANVSFLKPFLQGLGRIVPMRKLAIIRGYRVPTGLNEQTHASIIKHSYKKYTINLKVQTLVDANKSHKYETVEKILLDLAHELAHLIEWDHTPKHFEIQGKIMLHFADKLRKNGINDHSDRINRIRRSNED